MHKNMFRPSFVAIFALVVAVAPAVIGQVKDFVPVTDQMLLNPSPDDWLMFSRTYDAQRFSPLNQVNQQNVNQLGLAWARGMGQGTTETIPTVYKGVMYVNVPGGAVQALDATNGDLIWEYRRPAPSAGATFGQARSKTLAIYDDMIYYTAPDSYVVAIDARTGKLRWEAKVDQRGHTSGPIIVEGKVISGGTCNGGRVNCYISAHDAKTGKELWRFYTTQAPGEPPGPDTWAGAPVERRTASTWALPGSYDPARKLIFWGIANPTPNTRAARHGGNAFAIPLAAPADLYSNSTVALNPETGKLVPRHMNCSFITTSWWQTTYHPGKISLYVPYMENCLDMTSAAPAADGKPATPERRVGTPRPGADPNNLNGLAKVNVSTGEIQRWVLGKTPTNGAVLATAGDLIFFGDLNRRFRAFDADSGKILWET